MKSFSGKYNLRKMFCSTNKLLERYKKAKETKKNYSNLESRLIGQKDILNSWLKYGFLGAYDQLEMGILINKINMERKK